MRQRTRSGIATTVLRLTGLAGGIAGRCAVCLVAPTVAQAADMGTPVSSQAPVPNLVPKWTFYSAAYLWAAGVNGDARVLPPLQTSKVDVSFIDSLKDIEGGIIATGVAKYDRFLILGDVIGSRTTAGQTVSAAGVSGTLSSVSKSLITLGAVGYRVVDDSRIVVDAYVGARWWLMENSLSLYSPGIINAEVNKFKGWVDGVVGSQVRFNITDQFYANAVGFIGTGGAKFEWDLYAGLGYKINEKYEAFAGYRVLSVDYEKRAFLYNMTQHGPVVGVGIKF